jgi:hypothetical protein
MSEMYMSCIRLISPVVVATLLVPAALSAQINGRMGAGREFGQSADDPLVSEARPVNDVSVLIQHRQQLALSDSQFIHLVAIRRSVDSANFPLERRLDSLARVEHDASSGFRRLPADTVRRLRELARTTLDALAANIRPATERAHNLLTDHQIETAATFEQQAREMAEQEVRDAHRSKSGIGGFGRPPG